jgi:hypothetical protein
LRFAALPLPASSLGTMPSSALPICACHSLVAPLALTRLAQR